MYKIGDKVVARKVAWKHVIGIRNVVFPKEGGIYEVARVGYIRNTNIQLLSFKELKRGAFAAMKFRPLYDDNYMKIINQVTPSYLRN